MFRRAFYLQIGVASSWNGNADLTQIDALIAFSIFNDDWTGFNAGGRRLAIRSLSYFHMVSAETPARIAGDDGDIAKFWFRPNTWSDGLTQETCRDNVPHSQFALGSALHVAETAWHWGIDVYTPNQVRFTAALELLTHQFLSGSLGGTCGDDIPTTDR